MNMKRAFFLSTAIPLLFSGIVLAQSSPLIFTNPSADFSRIRRITLFPFEAAQTVQDPFAGTKATNMLATALVQQGIPLMSILDIYRQIEKDTQHTFSNPPTNEDSRIFFAELPRFVDAVLLGGVAAWDIVTEKGTRYVPFPVSGQTYGVVGQGGGISWQTTKPVPVTVTKDVSMVGAVVAMYQLIPDGPGALVWQYSYLRTDRGGGDLLGVRRRDPPDKVAEAFFQDVAKALPIRP
jgi:hypothetical protein